MLRMDSYTVSFLSLTLQLVDGLVVLCIGLLSLLLDLLYSMQVVLHHVLLQHWL